MQKQDLCFTGDSVGPTTIFQDLDSISSPADFDTILSDALYDGIVFRKYIWPTKRKIIQADYKIRSTDFHGYKFFSEHKEVSFL